MGKQPANDSSAKELATLSAITLTNRRMQEPSGHASDYGNKARKGSSSDTAAEQPTSCSNVFDRVYQVLGALYSGNVAETGQILFLSRRYSDNLKFNSHATLAVHVGVTFPPLCQCLPVGRCWDTRKGGGDTEQSEGWEGCKCPCSFRARWGPPQERSRLIRSTSP